MDPNYHFSNYDEDEYDDDDDAFDDEDFGRPGGGFGLGNLMLLPVSDADIHNNSARVSITHRPLSRPDEKETDEHQLDEVLGFQHGQMSPTTDDEIILSATTNWDICYLTSSPLVFGEDPQFRPLDQLNIKEEREEFFKTLTQANKQLRVIHMTANATNFIEAIIGGCRVIHYSGHGIRDHLAFEDNFKIGETHLLHSDRLRQICEKDEDHRINFVFASACHSQSASIAFLQAGIEHVVGVNADFEVTDEAASEFTRHFYYSLLSGRTVAESFRTAQGAVEAMSSSSRLDHNKFVLLPEDGDHQVRLFTDLQIGKLEDCTVPSPPNNLPPPVQPFIGREIDMRYIGSTLKTQNVRLLVLMGDKGIGKSATSQMIAKYFCDRRHFPGGVFYIDVKRLSDRCGSYEEMLAMCVREAQVVHDPETDGDSTTVPESNVWTWMRSQQKDLLLVFDGLHEFGTDKETYDPSKLNPMIQDFLKYVFDRTSAGSRVIVTTYAKFRGVFAGFRDFITRFHTLQGLSKSDCAKLFCRLANQFHPQDVERNQDLMHQLKNTPAEIAKVARSKHEYNCATLSEVVEKHANREIALSNPLVKQEQRRQKAREKIKMNLLKIDDENARTIWGKCHSSRGDFAEFNQMADVMILEFNERTMPFGRSRPLTQENLMYSFRKKGIDHRCNVPLDKYEPMYEYFDGICAIVKYLGDYWTRRQPSPIYGFCSREDAASLLDGCPEGTFLIRFGSRPSSLSISYLQMESSTTGGESGLCVRNLLCVFDPNPREEYHLPWSAIGLSDPFHLVQFILGYKKLTYLFDDSPTGGGRRMLLKEDFFFA